MALDFFAGCLGGCAGVLVGHPLDTVKVNLQTQDPKNPKYKGTLHCLKKIVAAEGLKGIYRGVSSPLGGVAAVNAVVFGVYGNVQRNFSDPDAISSHVLAGTLAGVTQSFLTSPIELAKTRSQLSKVPVSPLDVFKSVYRRGGVRGVYKGLGLTVAREIPAFSLYFATYEVITRYATNEGPVSTGTMLLAGGLAGMASWSFNYPIDVLKSRMQVDGMEGPIKYRNVWDCLRKGLASEGHVFLMRGFTPTVLRAFPTNAACFTVVTWTMRLCEGDLHIEISREKDYQML